MKTQSRLILLAGLALVQSVGFGQTKPEDKKPTPPVPATPVKPPAPIPGQPWDDMLQGLVPRQLGPVNMGGRIADLAVYEADPRIFYVASASGGVFKSVNGGTTLTPVFENQNSASIGAVAVSATNPDIVYVGTGESSARNSVAWGDGVYKSIDGGKTWQHLGLAETEHIAKIVIDPKNSDVAYVAAGGRLWGTNPERGIYKTEDGGKTWKHSLSLDDKTGGIDLKMDPSNPHVLLAAMWQRIRKPWDFVSGGANDGIYRSTDAGRSWHRVYQGLPKSNLGRIGLSYYRKNSKIVVATVEYRPGAEEKRAKETGQVATSGGGTFRSTDGGESWTMISKLNPRPFYFSLPAIDPNDDQHIYVCGDSLNVSTDGGKTFKALQGRLHPDIHAIWISPTNSNDLMIGCDGGLSYSHDKALTWDHLNGMAIAQFYAAAVDMRRPYWIYGGLQDNSCWGIPTQTSRGGVAFYDSVALGGGDGFHCAVDPYDWATVYSESQGGEASRVDLRTGATKYIKPRGTAKDGYRFNWSTPFILSPFASKTLYFGGNRLFKSIDRGDHWKVISPDLTTHNVLQYGPSTESLTKDDSGAEAHCTIITISESPLKQGALWVGTDDGQVQTSDDDGLNWKNVTANIPDLPAGLWCSRVLASKWSESRVYATFDGHRSNDFHPYCYVSEDNGKTWKKLVNGLPEGDSIYVVTEGERNPNLLYMGTEKSLRASLDRGQTWGRMHTNFPTVAVHDLVVHPKELDLVVATHGRSLWTVDVSALEQANSEAMTKEVALFAPQDVLLVGRIYGGSWEGDRLFVAKNTQPGTRIQYRLTKPAKEVHLSISTPGGERSDDFDATNNVGLNSVAWNGRIEGRLATPGDYRVKLLVDGKDFYTTVHVEAAYLNGNTPKPGEGAVETGSDKVMSEEEGGSR